MTAHILSVASAFPTNVFTQAEVCAMLGVTNPVVLRAAASPHIQTRHLMLNAQPAVAGPMPADTLESLDARFKNGVMTIGLDAARDAMTRAGVAPADIGTIVAVTSSGLALPGISAILVKELGVNRRAHRADLVGMGCNAGVSGVRTLTQMLAGRAPGTYGLLLCCEVSSALYVRNDSIGTGVVNSLFGDGAVAMVLQSSQPTVIAAEPTPVCNTSFNKIPTPRLQLVDFESATFPELFDDMRYDVDTEQQQYNFKLSKRIPLAVSEAVVEPVSELLSRHGLKTVDVKHWVVHSGGAAVINGVSKQLGLHADALRHTTSVLRDYGNLSSGSVLVSYQRLIDEHAASQTGIVAKGETVVLIGMGPGATVEVALAIFE